MKLLVNRFSAILQDKNPRLVCNMSVGSRPVISQILESVTSRESNHGALNPSSCVFV